MRALLSILLLLLPPTGPATAASAPGADFPIPDEAALLERVKIAVDPAHPRTFLYTNKRASFYAGETSAANRDPNQGLNVFGRKVLEDYYLQVDGRPLGHGGEAGVDVYPHVLVRRYPGGVTEEVSLLDGVDAIVVTVRGATRVAISPVLAGGSRPQDFEAVAAITPAGSGPALRFVGATPRVGGDIQQSTPRTVVAFATVGGDGEASSELVAVPGGVTPGWVQARGPEVRFVIAVFPDTRNLAAAVARLAGEAYARLLARRSRIAKLLADTYVETADPRFDRAFAWLVASGDALVTDQAGPGIWAGLYWFNNYWGRDTFISLPGIRLVTGQYEDARRILESFSRFQKTDPSDPLFGRIPNRVNSATDIIYNTADGTPWFVREAYEYVLYSGDTAFAREIYPAVKRATEGTLRYRVDSNGLLTHPDADTWMDAQWEGRIPWSPRGDRAVDVEALWHAQLEASARLARMAGDAASATRWEREAVRVRDAIRRLYRQPNSGVLYDHLNADGTPDAQVRPNEIFAITAPLTPILAAEEGAPVVRQVVEELTYRYGVASLAQTDPSFHPFHHDERWHYDAAYHNGTVWVWNAGPVVSALTRYGRQDMAYELTSAMVDQTLDLGAVGTLSELIDAIPKDGKLRLSGTETQAWSIAEFVRAFYQDYLGVHPDAVAGTLLVEPALPKALGTVRAVIPFRGDRIKLTLEPLPDGHVRCSAYAASLSGGVRLAVPGATYVGPRPPGTMVAGRALTLQGGMRSERGGVSLGPLRFATPAIAPGLKALAGEPTPVVRGTAADVAVAEPASAKVLYEASDPEGDDRGPDGRYTYPTDAHYEPGVLDLTGARVSADESRYYFTLRFRHLVDPGWHPELGFQLTYAAIAVDVDGVPGKGAVAVGKAADYSLPPELAFDRIVYVGGALEVDDASGKPLLTYSPATRDGALGNARDAVIRFSIPRSFIGDLTSSSRIAVLVGAQDDGGAAGLGRFRAVRRTAEQWSGGGADRDEGAPRVYDVLLPK